MRLVALLTLASVLFSGLAIGAQLARAQEGELSPEPPAAGAPAVPRVLSPDDEARRARVVARIGEISITLGQVEDEINALSPFVRARYRDPARLREYVEDMIQLELIAREAERLHYGDDEEVRRTTLESAVQYMIRAEIDERITADSISEADVLVYYDAHPEEFSRPEMRRASHILVATREEALSVIERARGGDMRLFRALAQDLTQDSETRTRGGDLRYFDAQGRGPNTSDPSVVGAIAAAAFALGAVGDLSEPVEVPGGFSVVKLTGIRPAEHRSAAAAADSIRMRLFRQRREVALETMVTELRARIPTEVHYERMANLRMEAAERASADPEADEVTDEGTEPSLDPLHPGGSPVPEEVVGDPLGEAPTAN